MLFRSKGQAILYSQGTDKRGFVQFACAEDADRLVATYGPVNVPGWGRPGMSVVDVTPKLLGRGEGDV